MYAAFPIIAKQGGGADGEKLNHGDVMDSFKISSQKFYSLMDDMLNNIPI
jgi:hypothetical protein